MWLRALRCSRSLHGLRHDRLGSAQARPAGYRDRAQRALLRDRRRTDAAVVRIRRGHVSDGRNGGIRVMATLLIALPILSTTTLQAAGGRADSEDSPVASAATALSFVQAEDPPADQQAKRMAYLERLAKKRLHLLGKRERRIVALL